MSSIKEEPHSSNVIALPKHPSPLPPGWVMKESRSTPDYFYYFHQETGVCSWTPPFEREEQEEQQYEEQHQQHETPGLSLAPSLDPSNQEDEEESPPHDRSNPKKREHTDNDSETSPPSSKRPKKVRVLHILKKHKDSRRPSSWRVPNITITEDQAKEELQGIMEVLLEVQEDPVELKATLEELARTESDCSSAKRGGDLGFFGPKKMQPAFEHAAFALEMNQLSDIVSTPSGVHVILRIG